MSLSNSSCIRWRIMGPILLLPCPLLVHIFCYIVINSIIDSCLSKLWTSQWLRYYEIELSIIYKSNSLSDFIDTSCCLTKGKVVTSQINIAQQNKKADVMFVFSSSSLLFLLSCSGNCIIRVKSAINTLYFENLSNLAFNIPVDIFHLNNTVRL